MFIISFIVLCGCGGGNRFMMSDNFEYIPVRGGNYTLATWQKIQNNNFPLHVYIEGDGHSFFADGRPSPDPTPRDSFVRDLATNDTYDNVVYIARPCQFIMDNSCNFHDWTDARFSADKIESTATTIKQIAGSRPVVLIGYSGGAMISGLVIQNHPEINVQKWITVAGVLNHHDWTEYMGDTPLIKSLDLVALPNVPQTHYVGAKDSTVPIELSKKWIPANAIKIIDNATHNRFDNLQLDL